MWVKIEQIVDLLDKLLLFFLVLIIWLFELVKELFIYKGLGMLVWCGEKVFIFDSWVGVDQVWLCELIEFSFGCKVVLDYFECIMLYCVYVSENYCVVMIFIMDEGLFYFDKFVVFDEVQGEGFGCVVWQVMCEQYLQLFWCLWYGNLVNLFYYVEFDGCFKQVCWKVFWYGLDGFDIIVCCVVYCVICQFMLVD